MKELLYKAFNRKAAYLAWLWSISSVAFAGTAALLILFPPLGFAVTVGIFIATLAATGFMVLAEIVREIVLKTCKPDDFDDYHVEGLLEVEPPTAMEAIQTFFKNHWGKVLIGTLAISFGVAIGLACFFLPGAQFLIPILLWGGPIIAPIATAAIGLQCFAIGALAGFTLLGVLVALKSFFMDVIPSIYDFVKSRVGAQYEVLDTDPNEESRYENPSFAALDNRSLSLVVNDTPKETPLPTDPTGLDSSDTDKDYSAKDPNSKNPSPVSNDLPKGTPLPPAPTTPKLDLIGLDSSDKPVILPPFVLPTTVESPSKTTEKSPRPVETPPVDTVTRNAEDTSKEKVSSQSFLAQTTTSAETGTAANTFLNMLNH